MALSWFPIAAFAGDSHDRHVLVINRTSYTMVRFHASNRSRGGWEEDILGNDVLRPGYQVRVNIDDGSGYCRYDFRAVFNNGQEIVRYDVDVCRVSKWTLFDNPQ
ncbi:MAG: hypothetical protein HY617_04110 [Candidatus Sungbacteria bacterium]|nr:hypothetical protein [Candidatus Sungbacteria bacterium]